MSKTREALHTNTTLVALYRAGRATASTLGITSVEALRLENQELLRRVDKVKTGKRGRPAVVWALTPKARDRARRRAQKETA